MTPARDALDQAIGRGSELLKQGKLDQAQRAFRAALELDPDNLKVLALLGLAHFRANEFDTARPIYEELAQRAPTDASHRLNLGLVFLKLNDAERAITALEESRALDPSQGRAVSYLGLAYARAGRYVEAHRAFRLAGQHELAAEIEVNLSPAELEAVHGTAPTPPPMPPPGATPPAGTPVRGGPRTKPPFAPPRREREEIRDEHVVHESSAEITIINDASGHTEVVRTPKPEEPPAPVAPPPSESQRFVLGRPGSDASAPQAPLPGESMVSRAIGSATPRMSTAMFATAGASSPRPLSDLATDGLVRPDEGTDTLELAADGSLLVRVTERVMCRLDGVHVTGGELAYEVATRRSRGSQTDERFDAGGVPMHVVSGKGYLVAVPPKTATFTALQLDDDILYVREDLVFAFETSLRWENGNVPGMRGRLHVVQFRGDGALALRLARPLVRVKLPPQGLVFVDPDRIAGWIGRVIPRAVVPPSGGPLGTMCVECTGEGVVLVEPAPERVEPAVAVAAAPRAEPPAPPQPPPLAPPEPPPPAEVSPEVADFAAELAAHSARDEI